MAYRQSLPFTRQPQVHDKGRFNRNNPLLQGCKLAWVPFDQGDGSGTENLMYPGETGLSDGFGWGHDEFGCFATEVAGAPQSDLELATPPSFDMSQDFTWEILVRFNDTSSSGNGPIIARKHTTDFYDSGIGIWLDTGAVKCWMANRPSGYSGEVSSGAITTGRLYHIFLSVENNNLTVHWDGASQTTSGSLTRDNFDYAISLGTPSTYNDPCADVNYYMARVWDHAIPVGSAKADFLQKNPWLGFERHRWIGSSLVNHTMTADAGSYTLTGFDANTEHDRLVTADAGSYALTGFDATTTISALLNAEIGTYSLTGQDANTLYDVRIVAEAGSYTLTGQDAATLVSSLLTAEVGAYTLTGAAAGTIYDRALDAEAGSYVLTGFDAGTSTSADISLNAETGVYTLTGFDAGFLHDYVMPAEVGTYTLNGFDATTSYSGAPIVEEGEDYGGGQSSKSALREYADDFYRSRAQRR